MSQVNVPERMAFVSNDPDPLYEVVDGRVIEVDAMGAFSSWIATGLSVSLFVFVKAGRLGHVITENLFVLDAPDRLKRRPDVAFISASRWPVDCDPPDGDWEVVPDIAIEVISPRDTDRAVQAKMREYFRYGVAQVWLLRPDDRSISVYESPSVVKIYREGDRIESGSLLPGWSLEIESLFEKSC